MNKKIYLIISIVVSITLYSCGDSRKPARGLEDEIYVLADSSEFEDMRVSLEKTFEKIIYTPQPEKLFTLKRIGLTQFDGNRNKKNIVIAAPLNSGSGVSSYLKSLLDSAALADIENGKSSVINKYDLWAKNQLVMVLSAPDLQELEFSILKNADNLIFAFQKISDARLKQSLYSPRYERIDIEAKLLKNYGWLIYVQADFQLALDKPEENFVWLRRSPNSDMERWIFVHWIENATPEYLNTDSIKNIRNRITEKFYKTSNDSAYVQIAGDYFTSSEINFNGRYALLTQGLWELNIKGMGGPFINYTFFDEKTGRIYMLDGSLFAPKYYKRNLIHQIDVLLQSFLTESELTKQRKEEILDELK